MKKKVYCSNLSSLEIVPALKNSIQILVRNLQLSDFKNLFSNDAY